MAQKTCPVCQLQQPDTSTLCDQCGWDFPIYLGSLEDAQKLGTRRLKEARAVWQETQERRQLQESVQEVLKRLVVAEGNSAQLKQQVDGFQRENSKSYQKINSLEQEHKKSIQTIQDLQQKLTASEQSRRQAEETLNLLRNRITGLEQALNRHKKISQKIWSEQPYTKIGHGGVELSDDATQSQGWMMTRDNRTGLIWEIKTSANQRDYYTWEDAKNVFINSLNRQRFGGFSDWRLPTIDELKLLIKRGHGEKRTIKGYQFLEEHSTYLYWSATNHSSYQYQVFRISSYSGEIESVTTANKTHHVRAVRSEQ